MDIFKHLKDNKALIIAQKKSAMKKADALSFNVTLTKKDTTKSGLVENNSDLDSINVIVVINTTNILDSHNDVHINGLWNKSLKEQRNLYLLQEHIMSFDKIITEEIKAYTKQFSFSDLGFTDLKGNTEALVFDAVIDSGRNLFMFEQYLKGYVKQHSVGMMYKNISLCINATDNIYKEEKAAWDKYITNVANKDKALEAGYFWAVTEAALIEGSAVPIGSNYATPTLAISSNQNIEADIITSNKQNNNKQYFINLLKT